jgi:hypothetical protein
MPRETAAERRERERQEATARYEASRIPATIADVRPMTMGIRSEINSLESDRTRLIEALRWLARNLNQEADYLEQDKDREASTSMMSSSLVVDISVLSSQVNARAKVLRNIVGELAEQGVELAGITVVKDQFNRTQLHANWER